MRSPVVIAGAGPAGSLLATYLGRAGHDVTVYESRPDLRVTEIDAGRSINLALATRGIVPLIDVGDHESALPLGAQRQSRGQLAARGPGFERHARQPA